MNDLLDVTNAYDTVFGLEDWVEFNTVQGTISMECFRIDESGYTGFGLLNPEQCFQGATAVAITDEDAGRLIKEYFLKLQASELKYRALARRPGNHSRLLGLQREILAN